MSFINVGDIFKLGEGALALWRYGFSQAANAEKQYADFGSAIQALGANVKRLGQIIENFTRQMPRPLSPEKQWDLNSLIKICGDFGKTIRECHQLLYDRRKFADVHESGFLRNIQWNYTIEPEVRRLNERVMFHNMKINTMLKPFEITLISDLNDNFRKLQRRQSELAGRVDEGFTDVLMAIRGILTPNAQEAIAQAMNPPPELPSIPEYMESKFEVATNASRKESHQELLEANNFPFYGGINSFYRHYNQSTILFEPSEMPTGDQQTERTPQPMQYLNLMKSIWIIKRIRQGTEWDDASSGRLSQCYMKELESKCAHEYSRFKTKDARQKLTEPDYRSISLLGIEQFRIWLDDDEEDTIESSDDYLYEILRVPLKSASRNRKQELVVIRRDDGELQLQNFTSNTSGAPNRDTIRDNVILNRAYMVPWYASPNSAPQAFNVTFRCDERIQAEQALVFLKLPDLLDFQNAITAYKVAFDKSNIKARLFQSTGYFSSRKTVASGRIQIWFPKRLEPRIQRPQVVNKDLSHRSSVITRRSNALSVPETFMTACTSSTDIDDVIGYHFDIPKYSMLVLYLKEDDNNNQEGMFILTILMDTKTNLKEKCGCDRRRLTCAHSHITRSGDLLAQKLPARADGQINLAAIGRYQAPKNPEYERKVKWLHIEFPSSAAREKFEDRFNTTKSIYRQQVHNYNKGMHREKLK